MKKGLIRKILVILLMTFIAGTLCYSYYKVSPYLDGDGLSDWRTQQEYKYSVIYNGRNYYCDHVESPAGFPNKLILYRGENYLLLPDGYAVEIATKKETK